MSSLYTLEIDPGITRYFPLNFFDIIVEEVISEESLTESFELSLSLISDEEIQKANSEYRNKNSPTDVLSFREEEAEIDFPNPSGATVLGDVLISKDTAKRQAKEKGHSYEYEIAFLFVHGILHLLDYDHERSEEEERVMFAKTDNIMSRIMERV